MFYCSLFDIGKRKKYNNNKNLSCENELNGYILCNCWNSFCCFFFSLSFLSLYIEYSCAGIVTYREKTYSYRSFYIAQRVIRFCFLFLILCTLFLHQLWKWTEKKAFIANVFLFLLRVPEDGDMKFQIANWTKQNVLYVFWKLNKR